MPTPSKPASSQRATKRDVGQGPTDRNPESDTEPGHLTNYLIAVSSSQ